MCARRGPAAGHAFSCVLALAVVAALTLHTHLCSAAALGTVQSVTQMWEQTAMSAAEATIRAIQKQTGREGMSLRSVPLESLKVFVGRQHSISIELDGMEYKLSFNTDADGGDLEEGSRGEGGGAMLGTGAQGAGRQALPAGASSQQGRSPASASLPPGAARRPALGPSSASGAFASGTPAESVDPFRWQRQHISLPEITLAGPVELVFPSPCQLTLFLPHSVEVPSARRLLLAPGAALTLRGIRGVSLRRPVELPKLPPSYLAEVLAHAKLGEPEPGFEGAPGMLYLASELYRQATNASFASEVSSSRSRQLLSFQVEPASSSSSSSHAAAPVAGGITAISAALPPSDAPARLRARRLADGSGIEVALRDPPAAAAARAEALSASAPGGVAPGAVASPPFSWPLPLVRQSSWLPYEQLLRGVIASHPFNLRGALRDGAPLRLTQSSLHGVSLVSFEMELMAGDPPPGKGPPPLGDMAVKLLKGIDAESVLEGSRGSLEVWEAVVQVKERADGAGGFEYIPVSVKKRHGFHSTLTLSPSGLADAIGRGNGSEIYSMTVLPITAADPGAVAPQGGEQQQHQEL